MTAARLLLPMVLAISFLQIVPSKRSMDKPKMQNFFTLAEDKAWLLMTLPSVSVTFR